MESSIFLHGKKYISARRGAEIAGYSGDYVGQLCREGKVEAERMGKIWFVSEESLFAHKREQERVMLAMKERSQQKHETCPIREVAVVSFAGYSVGDKHISTTHIPHTRPTAGYVEKVHALVAFGFVVLLVANMAQLNPRRYVASVYDVVRNSFVSLGQSILIAMSPVSDILTTHTAPQENNFSRVYTALAKDAYDLSAEKYIPDSRLIPNPQQLSFVYVADHLEDAGISFDADTRIVDIQRFERKKVQLHFVERARAVFDRYATFVDNTSQALVSIGSAVGAFSDHASWALQSSGIALSKKIQIASRELQMVGTVSFHKVQAVGFQLQNFGISLSQKVWIASRELQMIGTFSFHKVQTVGFELQAFGSHLSQKMLRASVELQAVGRHIGLAFQTVSTEFYNTGRLLALIAEYTSGVAQGMGRELVVEIAVVQKITSSVISQAVPLMTESLQHTQQTLLATVAETPIAVVDGTTRLGATARDNLTSVVARTYAYAQSLFVSDTYIAFMTRLFGVSPIHQPAVASDDSVEVPKSIQSGIVVMEKESTQSLELTKKQIQDSFSDEVSVEPDASGTAGIIRPVFKKRIGDEYLYMIVPIQK